MKYLGLIGGICSIIGGVAMSIATYYFWKKEKKESRRIARKFFDNLKD